MCENAKFEKCRYGNWKRKNDEMVREGLISRERALLRLSDENEIYYEEIQQVLNQVGIKDKSFLDGWYIFFNKIISQLYRYSVWISFILWIITHIDLSKKSHF